MHKGVLREVTDESEGTILVNGAWVRNGEYLWDDERDYLSQDKEFAKLMAIYQSRTCFLRSPEIAENRFRLNLVGDTKSLRMPRKDTRGRRPTIQSD